LGFTPAIGVHLRSSAARNVCARWAELKENVGRGSTQMNADQLAGPERNNSPLFCDTALVAGSARSRARISIVDFRLATRMSADPQVSRAYPFGTFP
jgi:hypothetical protein